METISIKVAYNIVLLTFKLILIKNNIKYPVKITIEKIFARIRLFLRINGLAGVSAGANIKNERKAIIQKI